MILEGLVFLAQFDVAHHIIGIVNSTKHRLHRRRKHHKLTDESRGATTIDMVPGAANMSGYDALSKLKKFGVPAWSGAILGVHTFGDKSKAPILQACVPASQEVWARYLLRRWGVLVIDGGKLVTTPIGAPPPRAWSDGPRPPEQAAQMRNNQALAQQSTRPPQAVTRRAPARRKPAPRKATRKTTLRERIADWL